MVPFRGEKDANAGQGLWYGHTVTKSPSVPLHSQSDPIKIKS